MKAGVVGIPDATLEQAIRDELNIPTGDVTDENMAGLTFLSSTHGTINDLTGLGAAVNLVSLNLQHNEINDLSPLSSLESVETLDVSSNDLNMVVGSPDRAVVDALVANGATALFDDNTDDAVSIPDANLLQKIRDALGKPAGNITYGDMAGLTGLSASGDSNPIVDLTGLESAFNVNYLNLSDNDISDLGPLSGLTNLSTLNLEYTSVSDLGPLSGLANLSNLNFANTSVIDLSPLAGLINLRRLSLWETSVASLAPLSGLSLLNLNFAYTSVSDLSPLFDMISLTDLYFSGAPVIDFSLLSRLTRLEYLGVGGALTSDLSPILDLGELVSLNLLFSDVNTSTGSPQRETIDSLIASGVSVNFEDLTGEEIWIPDNNLVQAIRSVLSKPTGSITYGDMAGLTSLDLSGHWVVSLEKLNAAFNLTDLNVSNSRVNSLEAIINFESLQTLNLIGVAMNLYSGFLNREIVDYLIGKGVAVSYFSLSADYLDFEREAGSLVLNAESTVSWDVVESTEWLSISPSTGVGNGVITVTAEANGGIRERTAVVSIGGEDIQITQKGIGETLVLSGERFVFLPNNAALDGAFELKRNAPWAATTSANWITLTTTSGDAGGDLFYSVNENVSDELRVGEIIVDGDVYSVIQGQYGEYRYAMGENTLGQLVGDGSISTVSTAVQLLSGIQSAYRTNVGNVFLKTDNTLWGISSVGFAPMGETELVKNKLVQLDENVMSLACAELSITSWAIFYIKEGNVLWSIKNGWPAMSAVNVAKVIPAFGGYQYITTAGDLYAVVELGQNNLGQFGVGDKDDHLTPVFVDSEVVDAAVGWRNGAYVKEDGTLWGSGATWSTFFDPSVAPNYDGILNPILMGSDVEEVEITTSVAFVRKTDGHLYGFGSNQSSIFGSDAIESEYSFDDAVKIVDNVVSFHVGTQFYGPLVYRISSGESFVLGGNVYLGTTGNGELYRLGNKPSFMGNDYRSASISSFYSFLVKNDNTLWASGYRLDRAIGSGFDIPKGLQSPTTIEIDGLDQISTNDSTTFYLDEAGNLYLSGRVDSYIDTDEEVVTERRLIASDVRSLKQGSSSVLLLKSDNSLWLLGQTYGELEMKDPTVATRIAVDVVDMSLGSSVAYWVDSSGDLYGVGAALYGELGDIGSNSLPNPLFTEDMNFVNTNLNIVHLIDTEVIQVRSSVRTVYYQKNDTSLWSLGYNFSGELGTGSEEGSSSIPGLVSSSVDDFTTSQYSGNSAFYLKNDRLYGWGSNGFFGSEYNSSESSPVFVDEDVIAFASGQNFAYVKSSGDLFYQGIRIEDGRQILEPEFVSSNVQNVTIGFENLYFTSASPVAVAAPSVYQDFVGGLVSIDILTYGPWVGFASEDWIELVTTSSDGASESVEFIVEPNPLEEMRTGLVCVGGQVITVTQGPLDGLVLVENELTLDSSASTVTIDILSNEPWVALEGIDWLTVHVSRGLSSGSLTFTVEANESENERTATFSVNGKEVQVVQKGSERSVIVSDKHFVFLPNNSILNGVFDLQQSSSWSAMTSASWITLTTPSGDIGDDLHYTVDGNTSGELRVGEIVVNGDAYSVVQGQYGEYRYAMGGNSYGQLKGDGSTSTVSTAVQLLSGIQSAYRSNVGNVFLKTDNTLWGISSVGFAPMGEAELVKDELVQLDENVMSLTGAESYGTAREFFYIKEGNILWTIENGQPVGIASNVAKVFPAFEGYRYITTTGDLYGVVEHGENSSLNIGQFGVGDTEDHLVPVFIDSDVVDAAVGWNNGAYVKKDGTLWGAGGTWTDFFDPSVAASVNYQNILNPILMGNEVEDVEMTANQIYIRKTDGHLYAFGSNQSSIFGADAIESKYSFNDAVKIVDNVGDFHVGNQFISSLVYSNSSGETYVLGGFSYPGAMGTGELSREVNKPFLIGNNYRSASILGGYSFFVKNDDTLWVSGNQLDEAIGSGFDLPKGLLSPVLLDFDGVVEVSRDDRTTFYLDESGDLYLSGLANSFIDVAEGVALERQLVESDVTAFKQGGNSGMIFLKSDGSLWLLGVTSGELKMENPAVATRLAIDAVDMALGSDVAYWVDVNGNLYGIGSSSFGNLGNTDSNALQNPLYEEYVNFTSQRLYYLYLIDTDVFRVESSSSTVYYQKANTSLWSMGNNYSGELGIGSEETESNIPTLVSSSVNDFKAPRYAPRIVFYLRDSKLYGWGFGVNELFGSEYNSTERSPVLLNDNVMTFALGRRLAYIDSNGNLYYQSRRIVNGVETYEPELVSSIVSKVTVGREQLYFTSGSPVVVNESSVVSGFEGSTVIVDISAYNQWVGFSSESWIDLITSSSDGSDERVTFVVEPNSLAETRSGFVSIGGQMITIIQEALDGLLLSISEFSLGFSESTITVDIMSSEAWTVTEDADWLTADVLSGAASATLTFSVEENISLTEREATVTIGDKELSIMQAGADPLLSLSERELELGASAVDGSIAITSNISWTVSVDETWLAVTSALSGTGDATLSFSVTGNVNPAQRQALITVGDAELLVTQFGLLDGIYFSEDPPAPSSLGALAETQLSSYAGLWLPDGESTGKLIGLCGEGETPTSFVYDLTVINATTIEVDIGNSNTATLTRDEFGVFSGTLPCVGMLSFSKVVAEEDNQYVGLYEADSGDPSGAKIFVLVAPSGETIAVAPDLPETFATKGMIDADGSIVVSEESASETRELRLVFNSGESGLAIETTFLGTYRAKLGADAATVAVDVGSIGNWAVAEDADWLMADMASGSGSGTVALTVDANTSQKVRIANVQIGSETFAVRQHGLVKGQELGFDAWLGAYYLDTEIAAMVPGAKSADLDRDGLSNEAEWKLGFDPTDFASRLEMSAEVDEAGTHVEIWLVPDGVVISLESSPNLKTWTAVESSTESLVDGKYRFDTSSNADMFYKVIVE